MAREQAFDPARLNVSAFAEAASSLQGQAEQHDLHRLGDSLPARPGDTAPPALHWSASGLLRPVAGGKAQVWLQLQAHTSVSLQCQRCLQPMQQALEVDRWFRFVASEDEAARLDEDSDEDVLVQSRHFDLLGLLEDEFILALPLVPMHETCPEPLVFDAGSAGGAEPEPEAAAPHAFAALAALRRPPGAK